MIDEALPRDSIVQLKIQDLGLGCSLVCIRPWVQSLVLGNKKYMTIKGTDLSHSCILQIRKLRSRKVN